MDITFIFFQNWGTKFQLVIISVPMPTFLFGNYIWTYTYIIPIGYIAAAFKHQPTFIPQILFTDCSENNNNHLTVFGKSFVSDVNIATVSQKLK